MGHNNYTLSIVIPVYNEEKNIIPTIKNIYTAIRNLNLKIEILIINDGSTDNTNIKLDILKKKYKEIKIYKNKINRGFGFSFKLGLKLAKKKRFLLLPGDNPIDKINLRKFIKNFNKFDFTYSFTSKMYECRGLIRTLISRLFTLFVNILTSNNYKYYNGFQIHQTNVLKKIKIENEHYTFQTELFLKTVKKYKKINSIDIKTKKRKEGATKAFKIKNIYETIRFLINLRNI